MSIRGISQIIILLLPALLSMTSCHHKELLEGSGESKLINVVFDWRDDPEAAPGSMALYLYPADGGTPLRYEFSGREGGVIKVPFGVYDAMCMNSDNTSWLHLSDTDERSTFGLYVGKLTSVSSEGEYVDVMQRCGHQTDGNDVAENPRDLWTGSFDAFEVEKNPYSQTLTIIPEYALCHYTVDIYDVKDIDKLNGHSLPAILTGMSEGIDALTRTSSTFHISSPLLLQTATRSNGSLHAEFLTFGEDAKGCPTHQIHVLTELSDGTWKRTSTDVTRQVHEAADPKNVHILIRGLQIPNIQNGGGLTADVDEWESENISLRM